MNNEDRITSFERRYAIFNYSFRLRDAPFTVRASRRGDVGRLMKWAPRWMIAGPDVRWVIDRGLVAVVVRLVGAFDGDADVVGLLFGELGELDA